jgi:hypothetical protein
LELPLLTAVFNPEKGPQPFLVHRYYNVSLHPKSNLRRDIEAIQGRSMDRLELASFDISKLSGVPCTVTLAHKISAEGVKTARIEKFGPVQPGVKVPKQITPSIVYRIEEGRGGQFNELPEFLQARIIDSSDWQEEKKTRPQAKKKKVKAPKQTRSKPHRPVGINEPDSEAPSPEKSPVAAAATEAGVAMIQAHSGMPEYDENEAIPSETYPD